MDAAAILRDTRLAEGLGQADLARRAGTSQTYISRVEQGEVSPSVATLARLLHAMGRRLSMTAEPLDHGNMSIAELQSDLRDRTAASRVNEAMRLSRFLTGVSVSAARQRERDGDRT